MAAMVAILKEPTAASRGLVVFTHKERGVLSLEHPVMGPLLERLRQRYVVGMHWGWFHQNVASPPYVDVHFGVEDTIQLQDEANVRRLPYNSSNFIPAAFRPRPELPKQWDIVSVTRTHKAKCTDELLRCLRLVYDRRPETRTLLVCNAPEEPSHKHQVGLVELYHELFSEEERERFSFLYLRGDALRPITREDIAFFYACSRVFTLFSDREGESRVIKEAMVTGLPVVAKAHLQGGGRQFFTPENSRVFTTIEEAAGHFVDLLENYDQVKVDADALARKISETHTVPSLTADLAQLYAALGEPFEGQLRLQDLSIRLPAHDPKEVPVSLQEGPTADLNRPWAMATYLRHVVDGVPVEQARPSPDELTALRTLEPQAPAESAKATHPSSKVQSRKVRAPQAKSPLARFKKAVRRLLAG